MQKIQLRANNPVLKDITTFGLSSDARAPLADITNARELFGDADYGDSEDGDADFGDAEDGDADYGDSEMGGPFYGGGLSDYNALYGDSELGDTRVGRALRRVPKGVRIGAGIGVGALTAYKAAQLYKRIRAEKARKKAAWASRQLASERNRQTIHRQTKLKATAGPIPKNAWLPFFAVTGAALNSSPISVREHFVADTLKFNLNKQAVETPFEVDTVVGTFAGVTWTLTAVGTLAARYYVACIISVGINALNGNPGTIYNLTGNMPTINGALAIGAPPFSFTIQPGYFSRFIIYPWTIVTNKPLPVMGQYSTANPIIFQLTGLPASASVNMIVPGSEHDWTQMLRNRLL